MFIKLEIASLKWNCRVPENILSETILGFTSDFVEESDMVLEIKYAETIDVPKGNSITNEILDWYLIDDNRFKYCLIKREETTGKPLVYLKSNYDWSDVIIEVNSSAKIDSQVLSIGFSVKEIINILLLEIIFRNRLLFHNGIVLHSSAVDYKGEAILFTAPSGTGKSTHASFWVNDFGAKIINDDHPALIHKNGKTLAHGTPWAGERGCFINGSRPIKAIVVIEQGKSNSIERLSKLEILKSVFPRCFIPYYDKNMMDKAIGIFEILIGDVDIYRLSCRPEVGAAELVRDTIFN